ncbi:MAG: hypothetical protein ACYDB5_09595 [bacterium]
MHSYFSVRIAIEVLNDGLRPHLTMWQARFRKWYDAEIMIAENENLSPQELQKRFIDYEKLVKDMKDVNQKLINYKGILQKLAIFE